MSNSYHGKSYIKEGEDSLIPSISDIHDKVINLLFIRDGASPITIRSDYEIIHHPDGKYSFKRCTEKPEIKISYKQVANTVAIEVDIEVTNFNIGDRDKKPTLMDTLNSNPATSCLVQIGYRKQFPDWTNPKLGYSLDDYYNLRDRFNKTENFKEIQVQILASWVKSYPPDSVIYFKGIIGTMMKGMRWNPEFLDLVHGYGSTELENLGLSEIEQVLFQFVTRRFIRPNIRGITYTHTLNEDGHVVTEVDSEKIEKGDDGIMTVKSALEYGVICSVSARLSEIHTTAEKYDPTLSFEENEEIGAVPAAMYGDQYEVLGGQLADIQRHYPYIRWQVFTDGNYYFYHVEEKNIYDPDLFNNETYFFPAIYDMTSEGTRTIRAPFYTFINPFRKVGFKGRYQLGTFTSYFYPVQTNVFLVISVKLDFSTTQDDNTMELVVVDSEEEEAKGDMDGMIPQKEAAKSTKRRVENAYIERTLIVVPHRQGVSDAFSSIENIVYSLEGEGTETEKVDAVRRWNWQRWTGWMSRGNSIENLPGGIGHRTRIDVPWLYVGDEVTIRVPYRSEYGDE